MFHSKYFPKSIDDCKFNKNLIERFEKIMAKYENLLNTIVYGPEGSGKKTLVYFLLSAVLKYL